MGIFKKSTAWTLVLCLVLSLALSVSPMTPEVNAAEYNPFVFYLGPPNKLVPEYYQTYAKSFVGWSPFQISGYGNARIFNLTNVDQILKEKPDGFDDWEFRDKLYASTNAFCGDKGIMYYHGTRYRRISLEDAHFARSGSAEALEKARKVRAIVRHSLPYYTDASAVQEAANKYFGSEVVVDLTNEEMVSGGQAAVWYYTNDTRYSNGPFSWWADYKDPGNAAGFADDLSRFISKSSPLNIYARQKSTTKNNINKVFEYLINLPSETTDEVLIKEDSLSVEKAFLSGTGSNCTVMLYVNVVGTIDANDDLVLGVKCGSRSQSVALGGNGIQKNADGLFPVTLTGVSEADCANVQLELTGNQTVTDAFFFEAEGGKNASQGFASHGTSTGPVYAEASFDALADAETLEIVKVDAQSGNPLSGVAFDLYLKQSGNDLKIGSYVTDSNGKITLLVTDPEDYYFVETGALKGYEAVTGTVTSGRVPNSWNAGSLSVTKKLINTTPAQPDEAFDFKLTLDLSTAPVMSNGISWMTADYLKGQLESSKALTWSVSGKALTAAFTVNADETVSFGNIPLGTTYTVEEVMTDEDREWFTVTSQVDDQSAKNSNLATGTVAEKNAVLFTNSVATTEVKLGELSVSKKLVNTTPAQIGETFKFQITLDLSTSDAMTNGAPWITENYLMSTVSCTKKLSWMNINGKRTATFTVDADQTVTVKGIPLGTTYTVEEILSAADQEKFTVTSKVDDQSAKNAKSVSSTVAEKNAVVFTNTVVTTDVQLANLNVSKKLVNTTPAQVGETFNFRITLDFSTADAYTDPVFWLDDDYLLGKISCTEALNWTEKNGKYTATFTVNADQTIVIKGLATGTSYTLEEVLSAAEQEKFTVTSKVGNEPTQNSLTANGSIAQVNAVLFTNTVATTDIQLANLNVSKKLVNTTPAQVGETFNFRITLDFSTADAYTDPVFWLDDDYLLGKISCTEALNWTEKNGKYAATFTVNADQTVVIKGIALGTTYTVEEILTAEEQQWFTVTSKVNNDPMQNSNAAQSTVAALNGLLFTNTVVTGDTLRLGDLTVSKKLVNTTPAQVGETFNFRITLDFSTADAYTNAAPWLNDRYLLDQISCTENLSWTAKDGKYTATFTVNADQTVTVKGIAYGVTYQIEEILSAEDRERFTVTSTVNSETAKNSEVATSTVAQRNAVLFTNTVPTADVTLGELSVSKKLVNTTPAQVGETFNFRITLDFSTADAYADPVFWLDDDYLLGKISCTEALNWTEKNGKYTATFTVDADETVTIQGLATGTTYTVEEILTAEELEWFTVTSQINDQAVQNSPVASSTVAQKNALVFTNTVVTTDVQLSKLAVSKKLVNTTPAQVGETFNFRITIDFSTADAYKTAAPWLNDAYLLGKISENLSWTAKDGKYTATFTVDADETVIIDGLATGTSYTVEEVLTAEDRAWFTVTSKVGNEPTQNSNTAEGSVAQINAILFTNTVVSSDVALGNLDVSKKLVNTTPAQVGETFNFRITLDFSTADAYTNAAPWLNDTYLLGKISSTEALNWTEKDGKYTATFTVNADDTFSINGIAQGSTYTVQEILTEEDRQWFTTTSQIGEQEATASDTVESTVAKNNALLFTNTVVTTDVQLSKLAVSKKLVNTTPAQVGETFNFRITLDFSTADAYTNAVPWMNDAYLLGKISENLSWTAKDGKYTATFTVDADETVIIDGLATGTSYTVEEVLTAEDRAWFTVTSKVGNEPTQNSNTAEGSVAQINAILFTNTVVTTDVQLSKLAVSKKLVNTSPAQVGETFHFRVTLDFSTADAYTNAVPWMNDEYLLSFVNSTENLTWTQQDGKFIATFTVDADETVTIDGLAYGTCYTVEEIMTEEDWAWFNVTSKVGNEATQDSNLAQGSVGQVNAVLFTNSVVTAEIKRGTLNVIKKLVNTTPAEVGKTFTFQITVDFDGADIYSHGIPWVNDEYLLSLINTADALVWTQQDGKFIATFTVDADEAVSFEGLACGASFTVEEILTEEERNWFETNTQTGDTILAGRIARGTVSQRSTVLFTNSVVTGPVLVTGSVDVSKTLINTTPAQVGETFNFRITLDLSTADVYVGAAPWMNDEYLMSFVTGTETLTWTEDNGKYTADFTVNAGETFSVSGIAQGSTYTVQEILTEEDRQWFTTTSQIDGQETTASDTVESIVAEQNALLFTNTVVTGPELLTSSLDITKELINNTPAAVNQTFNFRISLDFSTADVYTNAAPWMNDEYLLSFITATEELIWAAEDGRYVATFTVDADETVTIEGLAHGTTYTLQEVLTEEDRQWFTTTSRIGQEEDADSDTVESTVTDQNEVTFTNTVVTGTALATGRLRIGKELADGSVVPANTSFTFRVTLNLAEADIYQDPVPWMFDEYLLDKIEGDQPLTWTHIGEKLYVTTFTLKAGEALILDGVAVGTGFTVEEVLSKEDRNNYRVTTRVSTNGGITSEQESCVATGNMTAENDVIITNRYVAPIPVTEDISLTMPIMLGLIATLMCAVLILNKRRIIGK